MKFLTVQRLALIILLTFCVLNLGVELSPTRAQQVTLRVMVWDWPEVDEALHGALAEFEKSLAVIQIDLIRVARTNYWAKLWTSFMSGEGPDVLYVHHDMVCQLRGHIIALDCYVAERPELIEGIPDEVLESFRCEGHLYGIPLGADGEFALNAYAISSVEKAQLAVELILLLRSRIPPVVLDQAQEQIDYGFWFDQTVERWQEFRPTGDELAKIDIKVGRQGNPGNVLISLKTEAGTTLWSTSLAPPTGVNWISATIEPNISVEPERIYRIHVKSSQDSPDPSDRYFWRGKKNCTYDRGRSSVDPSWPGFDFAFRIYKKED